jgi:cathepsin B
MAENVADLEVKNEGRSDLIDATQLILPDSAVPAARYLFDKINEERIEKGVHPFMGFVVKKATTQIQEGVVFDIQLEVGANHNVDGRVINTFVNRVQNGIESSEDSFELVYFAVDKAVGSTEADVQMHYPALGLLPKSDPSWDEYRLEVASSPAVLLDESLSIPASFDAREVWPECKWLHAPLNQGSCGSCWAYTAGLTYSTRLCTMSNSKVNIVLSTQDITTCATSDGKGEGCKGGLPAWAYGYMEEGKPEGIVDMTCAPYTGKDTAAGATCGAHCGGGVEYHTQRGTATRAPKNEAEIMQEIFEYGAVTSCFDVYDTFNGKGIYKDKGQVRGGHGSVLIGWGVEGGVKYWLAENSWGAGWGDKGYFKVLRGENFADIEKWCPGAPLPVVPKQGCDNGGSPQKDGSCQCIPGTSGARCSTCSAELACKNGGTRRAHEGCDVACTCPAGTTGQLCQQTFALTCGAGNTKLSWTGGALKEADLVVFSPTNMCDGEALLAAHPVDDGVRKTACGSKQGWPKECAASGTLAFSPPAASGTMCLFRYNGVNEFGNDKGWSATGKVLGTCGAPDTPAPTALPTGGSVGCLDWTNCEVKLNQQKCSSWTGSLQCMKPNPQGPWAFATDTIHSRFSLDRYRTSIKFSTHCEVCQYEETSSVIVTEAPTSATPAPTNAPPAPPPPRARIHR